MFLSTYFMKHHYQEYSRSEKLGILSKQSLLMISFRKGSCLLDYFTI